MAMLPICDELRRSVNSFDWEPQFILRCHREISNDMRLSTEINALCDCLTVIVDERVNFVNELNMLPPEFVPVKMAELMKQIQDKDIRNLMKLQTLGKEFELRGLDSCVIHVVCFNFIVVWSSMCLYQDWFAISAPIGGTGLLETNFSGSVLIRCDRILLLFLCRKLCLFFVFASELRYKADSWVWNDVLIYFCLEAAEEDRQIATKLNRLCEELLVLCEKTRNMHMILKKRCSSRRIVETCVIRMALMEDVGLWFVRERAREIDLFVQDLRREDRLRSVSDVCYVWFWFFGMPLCKVRVFYLLIDTTNIGTHCDVVMSKVSVEPRDTQLLVAIWAAAEDRRFAMRMNLLRREIVDVCEYKRNLADELCSVRSVIAPVKAAELLNDTLMKDEAKMAQLRELERQLELRALEKEMFIQKLVRNVPF
ncbi:hypothetical protein Tco_1046665 [Tanacetum coccineum]